MENVAKEKSLKQLLGDMGPDGEVRSRFAATSLEHIDPELKGLSYDEAVALGNDAFEVLKHTPPGDPAWNYMTRQQSTMFGLAALINDSERMGRHDHEVPYEVLVRSGDTVVDAIVYIRKDTPERAVDRVLQMAVTSRIGASSEWSESIRFRNEVEVVRL